MQAVTTWRGIWRRAVARLGMCLAAALVLMIGAAGPSRAEGLSALARALAEGSGLTRAGAGAELVLRLTQPVPYRIFGLTGPDRLVIDFSEVDWSGFDAGALRAPGAVDRVLTGGFRPGWTRMVLVLDQPLALASATMTRQPDQSATLRLSLAATGRADFDAAAGAPADALIAAPPDGRLPVPQGTPRQRQRGDRPLVVVLDPGHGGVDPGAESEGHNEAALMLTFARELREALLRAGGFDVLLTRDSDVFVPLESRVSIARAAEADVFLSLHADALVDGRASGATIYTLSEAASDLASQTLAERHDRADLLAGVDLTAADDVIADVLMDMARVETAHRTAALADALVTHMELAIGLHKRPHLSAGFSVLKAPDVPSVLIELGFLSAPRDRERLIDAAWRQAAADSIVAALRDWASADAAEAVLLRP